MILSAVANFSFCPRGAVLAVSALATHRENRKKKQHIKKQQQIKTKKATQCSLQRSHHSYHHLFLLFLEPLFSSLLACFSATPSSAFGDINAASAVASLFSVEKTKPPTKSKVKKKKTNKKPKKIKTKTQTQKQDEWSPHQTHANLMFLVFLLLL